MRTSALTATMVWVVVLAWGIFFKSVLRSPPNPDHGSGLGSGYGVGHLAGVPEKAPRQNPYHGGGFGSGLGDLKSILGVVPTSTPTQTLVLVQVRAASSRS